LLSLLPKKNKCINEQTASQTTLNSRNADDDDDDDDALIEKKEAAMILDSSI